MLDTYALIAQHHAERIWLLNIRKVKPRLSKKQIRDMFSADQFDSPSPPHGRPLTVADLRVWEDLLDAATASLSQRRRSDGLCRARAPRESGPGDSKRNSSRRFRIENRLEVGEGRSP